MFSAGTMHFPDTMSGSKSVMAAGVDVRTILIATCQVSRFSCKNLRCEYSYMLDDVLQLAIMIKQCFSSCA